MCVLYSVSLCYFVYWLCVNLYWQQPPGLNWIKLTKYMNIKWFGTVTCIEINVVINGKPVDSSKSKESDNICN